MLAAHRNEAFGRHSQLHKAERESVCPAIDDVVARLSAELLGAILKNSEKRCGDRGVSTALYLFGAGLNLRTPIKLGCQNGVSM